MADPSTAPATPLWRRRSGCVAMRGTPAPQRTRSASTAAPRRADEREHTDLGPEHRQPRGHRGNVERTMPCCIAGDQQYASTPIASTPKSTPADLWTEDRSSPCRRRSSRPSAPRRPLAITPKPIVDHRDQERVPRGAQRPELGPLGKCDAALGNAGRQSFARAHKCDCGGVHAAILSCSSIFVVQCCRTRGTRSRRA